MKRIREYYEHIYDNKFKNLNKMDKYIVKHKLLKLSQEELDTLNSPTIYF